MQPTVVALGSSPELDGITRLGGRPLQPPPQGLLGSLLGSLLPGAKQAKEDAQARLGGREGRRVGWVHGRSEAGGGWGT